MRSFLLIISLLVIIDCTVSLQSITSKKLSRRHAFVYNKYSSSLSMTSETNVGASKGVYGSSYRYDAAAAEEYFSKYPIKVFSRFVELASASTSFLVALGLDYLTGRITDPEQEQKRGDQLTGILTQLGPTFIKVGQSLSIRADLLRPAYIEALTKLQDRVPPFPTSEARVTIAQELKQPIETLFPELISETKTVASASVGQVYKVLYKGEYVAVKVQRPDILEQIALDMHLLRIILPVIRDIAGLQSDVMGIVDGWGRGFVDELDYEKEAANANTFMKSLEGTPLEGVVFAPEVVPEISTRRVLTTKWVDGERLEACADEDKTLMCSLAMTTYLTMLLECPIMQADSHPGNLRRTPDGRLCIMDWGLVTSLPPGLQVYMIEHIAHLTSKDYAQVPSDLVKLQFIPADKEALMAEAGVAEALGAIYGELAKGGGAANIDVNGVFNQLNGLSASYGNLFQLPPYFAYIARAFGVLEGIGLSSDPKYAILGECLPYISQRILSDNKGRSGDALNTFIYGADKNKPDRILSAERIELLVEGFSSYNGAITKATAIQSLAASGSADSASSSSSGSKAKSTATAQKLTYFAQTLANLLLGESTQGSVVAGVVSSRGISQQRPAMTLSPLQAIIIEELAKVVGASTRVAWNRVRQASGKLPSGRSVLGTLVDPIGLFRESTLVEANDWDIEVMKSARTIIKLLSQLAAEQPASSNLEMTGMSTIPATPMSGSSQPNTPNPAAVVSLVLESVSDLSSNDLRQVIRSLASIVWERRRGIPLLGTTFLSTLIRQTANRVDQKRNPKV